MCLGIFLFVIFLITIAASEEWWAEKIKVIPAAKKFQYGGIAPELEEKLNTMFSQVVATREDSWAPSIGSLPPDVVRIQLEDDDVADNTKNNQGGPEDIGGASTPPGNASSASKRRKIGKNKGMVFSLTSNLHQSTLAVKPPPVITVKEVVELISSSPELRANLDQYYFALDHIRDKTTREIFMSIPEDMRVWWIMKAYEKRAQ
ncbi:hypothetical protein KSP40_PGU009078 [Platanthera guangdongensis]|uniref:Uncharacterized protein n=1 Tax=Platanthera guangdongensis TaxID=2320717 RepID=A0ABR2LHG8_9ASPA